MLRSRYCVYFVLMNGLIGGVARGAADIGRIARIGGMMRSFGRIQQVVLGVCPSMRARSAGVIIFSTLLNPVCRWGNGMLVGQKNVARGKVPIGFRSMA